MSRNTKVTVGGGRGITFSALLGLVFVTLKLTGYITWSWWLVTLPFWGGLALVILFLLVVGAIIAFFAARK